MTSGATARPDRPRSGPWPRWLWAALVAAAALAGIGTVVAAAVRPAAPPPLHGVAADGLPAAPDFALTDQHGRTFRLADARGSAVLLVFGYTSCPDVCPLTLATWARARSKLGDLADRTRFVFISVDPEHDPPDRVGRFVAQFDQAFVGLTGSPADVEATVVAYGAYARVEPIGHDHTGPVVIAHSEATFLIDPAGRLVEAFPGGSAAEDIARDLRTVLDR